MKKIELLAPAGTFEKAKLALDYGADAVFLGAKSYSLRARASNFSYEQIDEIIKYAHTNNKKVYIVANVLCHNFLIPQLDEYLKTITSFNPDGFIVADPTIIYKLKKDYPQFEIHISTQQSTTNSKAALFWKRNHATRVVLSRELSLKEIEDITINLKDAIELEVFIHGAVCISYSGRCMMSNNFSLRDANVGGCAQSCRWAYEVQNEEIHNKSKYFTMSAKDMVQATNIKELMRLNIASLKIEGRMKSEHYIATVCSSYRHIIDDTSIANVQKELKELDKIANRPTDTAFLNEEPGYTKMLYHDVHENLAQDYIFMIKSKNIDGSFNCVVKNNFNVDTKIEIFTINQIINNKITKIIDAKTNEELFVCPTPMEEINIYFEHDMDLKNISFGRKVRN